MCNIQSYAEQLFSFLGPNYARSIPTFYVQVLPQFIFNLHKKKGIKSKYILQDYTVMTHCILALIRNARTGRPG